MCRIAMIGHRTVFGRGVEERLLREAERQIGLGCRAFTMGTHGDFDRLALSVCRALRERYPSLEIEVVVTGLNALKAYSDVKTVMFGVEEVHFKRRITASNRKMIDGCDGVICYVDERAYGSGAKAAMKYAKERGLPIVNLYREEDGLFYGMTQEEIEEYQRNFLSEKKRR